VKIRAIVFWTGFTGFTGFLAENHPVNPYNRGLSESCQRNSNAIALNVGIRRFPLSFVLWYNIRVAIARLMSGIPKNENRGLLSARSGQPLFSNQIRVEFGRRKERC
jgi:hypothetical protein